jgi:23S rRNA (guanosine2251-2'-O)-methyltransferase
VPAPRTEARQPRSPDWVLGFHAVLAALEAEAARVEVVLLGEGGGGGRAHRIVQAARRGGVRTRTVPRRELDEVAAGVAHNGFAARVAPRPYADPETLLERPAPVLLLGLDGLEDGHNLGAAVRVAASFSLGGVLISGPHPPPLGGAAAKVAAGTLSLVPIAHVGALGDFALRAKDAQFWVFGADARGEPVDRLELPDRLVLCIGAEAGGLRAKTRAAVDALVSIPIAAAAESLNLSVAAGILAWEWRRRHPLPRAAS